MGGDDPNPLRALNNSRAPAIKLIRSNSLMEGLGGKKYKNKNKWEGNGGKRFKN